MLPAEGATCMKPQRLEQIGFAENEIREVNKGRTVRGTVCLVKERELYPVRVTP